MDTQLIEFFGVEPERVDFATVFRVQDTSAVWEFLFDSVRAYVQTSVKMASESSSVTSHEGKFELRFFGETLVARFESNESSVEMRVKVNPVIQVHWIGLRND